MTAEEPAQADGAAGAMHAPTSGTPKLVWAAVCGSFSCILCCDDGRPRVSLRSQSLAGTPANPHVCAGAWPLTSCGPKQSCGQDHATFFELQLGAAGFFWLPIDLSKLPGQPVLPDGAVTVPSADGSVYVARVKVSESAWELGMLASSSKGQHFSYGSYGKEVRSKVGEVLVAPDDTVRSDT